MISDIQLLEDLKIIAEFSEHFANSVDFGVPMNISEKIKTDVEKYMTRKKHLYAVEENQNNQSKFS